MSDPITLAPVPPEAAPVRTQEKPVFDFNIQTWNAWEQEYVPYWNTTVPLVNAAVTTVLTSVDIAEDAKTAALAASNFLGPYSEAVGAATAGSAFSDGGKVWGLLVDKADITTSLPSLLNAEWALLSAPDVGKAIFSTSGSGDAGISIALSGNDTIEAVSNTAQSESIEAPQQLSSAVGYSGGCTVEVPEEGVVVHFYTGASNYLYAKVGEVEAGGVSTDWGDEQSVKESASYNVSACLLNGNRVAVVAWESNFPAAIFTVDGAAKTISVVTPGFQDTIDWDSSYTLDTNISQLVRVTDTSFAMSGRDNADTYPKVVAMSESSGTITTGAELQLEAAARTSYGLAAGIIDGIIHPITEDGSNGLNISDVLVDGTTCTLLAGPINNDVWGSGSVSGAITTHTDKKNGRIFIAGRRAGSNVTCGRITSGVLTTFGEVQYDSSTNSSHLLAYLPLFRQGEGIVGILAPDAGNSNYPTFYQINVNKRGELALANSGTQVEASVMQNNLQALGAQDSVEKRFVFGFVNNGAADIDATLIRPAYDDTNAHLCIGFADAAFIDASAVVGTIPGGINDDQSGLVAGKEYGIQKDGTLDYQHPETWYARGFYAKSATEIINGRTPV